MVTVFRSPVLHVASFDRWSGAAAPALAETASLRQAGIDAAYAFTGGYLMEEKLRGVPWAHPVLVRGESPWSVYRNVRALRKLIRTGGFEIIHTHLSHDHWLARLAIGRKRPIASGQDLPRPARNQDRSAVSPAARCHRCARPGQSGSGRSSRTSGAHGHRHAGAGRAATPPRWTCRERSSWHSARRSRNRVHRKGQPRARLRGGCRDALNYPATACQMPGCSSSEKGRTGR